METTIKEGYSIERKSNILQVEAFVPFTEEVTEKYIDDIYRACEEFSGQPWGLLISFYGNSVFTPDVEESLIKVNKYRVEQGLIASATVLINSSTADIQQLQLRRIYQACDITFYVFSDVDNARVWLENHLKQNE